MGARRNPLVNSKLGGRILSASQLWFFLWLPPRGYGVLTTIGRSTGKRRRRCVRVVRCGNAAVVVAIKGRKTGWLRNATANPEVRLRIRGRFGEGVARTVRDPLELERARAAYVSQVFLFDYLTFVNWRRGRPTARRIQALTSTWFETGTPLILLPGPGNRPTPDEQQATGSERTPVE